MIQNLNKFFFGVIFAPVVILLHECGHYIAATALGFSSYFHFAETGIRLPQPTPPHILCLTVGAGPAVEALLTSVGSFWLRHLRKNRLQSVATYADWLATFLILCAGRWLRAFASAPSNPMPSDEAKLSANFGLPSWFLPYLLALMALAILMAAISLHPRGNRLVPFASAILGMAVGIVVWLKIIGPRILP
jgi:hypothetical protein